MQVMQGARGVRHCCSCHHEGHPRVMGGGQRCLPVQGGGAAAAAGRYALRRASASASSLIRGRGGRSNRAGGGGAAPRRLARPGVGPWEGFRGGHLARGGSPSYGRGAWRGREGEGRICSRWITCRRRDQGGSHCSHFSACRAGRCSAAGTGRATRARVARWRRRRWPYAPGTGPRLVPPARSAERSTAAGGHTKGTAWMRRKRAWRHGQCGHGCSPHRQPGPDRRWPHGPCGIRRAAASAPTRGPHHRSEQREVRARRRTSARATRGNLPTPPPRVSMGGAHSLSGSGMLDGRGELRRPLPLPPPPHSPRGERQGRGGQQGVGCRCRRRRQVAQAATKMGGGRPVPAATAITRGIPGCWGEDNGACRSRGGGYSSKRACCPPEGRRSCQPP